MPTKKKAVVKKAAKKAAVKKAPPKAWLLPDDAVSATIKVVWNRNGEPTALQLAQHEGGRIKIRPDQQLVFDCPEGHLELRFSPRLAPFTGHKYECGAAWPCPSGSLNDAAKQRLAERRQYPFAAIVTTAQNPQSQPERAGYLLAQTFLVELIGPTAVKKTARKAAKGRKKAG